MMNQPSEEDRAAARSQALLSLGLGMMANSTGPRGANGLGQIVGRAGLGSMDDYQRSLMMAQQKRQQEMSMGMGLMKMKREAQQQEQMNALNQHIAGIMSPKSQDMVTGFKFNPEQQNGVRFDTSNPNAENDYIKAAENIYRKQASGVKISPDEQMILDQVKGRISPVVSKVPVTGNIGNQLRDVATAFSVSNPEVAKALLAASEKYQPDYAQVDLGNGIAFVDKRSNVPAFMQKGVSPESASRLSLDRERFAWEQGKETKPQWDAGSRQFIVPPSATDPTGKAMTPQGMQPKDKTGEQAKAAGFLSRMTEAEKILSDPSANDMPSYPEAIGSSVPFIGGTLGNMARDPNRQKYYNAKEEWVRAKLRKESGAVIGKDEMDAEIKTYFPVLGDSPELIAQKSMLRRQAMDSINMESGDKDQKNYPLPKSKSVKLDDGKSVIAVLGADGKYYTTMGGKKFRVEE